MSEISAAVRSDLAPNGKLRAGINFGNKLLTSREPGKEPSGVAVDMARELARRLGVPLEIVAYDSAGALSKSATSGAWEVGFLGAEPARAKEIDFTSAYVEIESTYLVPPGSSIKSIDEVDRPGIRIALGVDSAYDLYLTRTLKHAQLVRPKVKGDSVFDMFVAEKIEVLAGLRPGLIKDQKNLPGSRILDGQFTAVQQAAGMPKGHPAGVKFLNEFIEDAKATGFVARALVSNGMVGRLTVAPKASA